MLANQLPLLQMGRTAPANIGQRHNYCSVDGDKYHQRLFKLLNIVAIIIFVIFSLILYYLLPAKFRWIALLFASYTFYIIGGKQTIIYMIFTTLTTYFSGLVISKLNTKLKKLKYIEDKRKENEKIQERVKLQKRLMVAFAAVSNFGLLFFFKYWNFAHYKY